MTSPSFRHSFRFQGRRHGGCCCGRSSRVFHSGFSSRHSRGDLVSGKMASSASASASASALTRESLGDDDQDQTQQSSSNPSPSPYTDDADERILRWTARIGGVAAIGAAGALATEGRKLKSERVATAQATGKAPPTVKEYYANTALGRLAPPLLVLQTVLLVGSIVGGSIASRRRVRLEKLVHSVKELNKELRTNNAASQVVKQDESNQNAYAALASAEVDAAVAAQDDEDAILGLAEAQRKRVEAAEQQRSTLERSLQQPAAAHPTERVDDGVNSVADARRKLRAAMERAGECLSAGEPAAALESYDTAMSLAATLGSRRASVATARGAARALTELGQHDTALKRLLMAADLSAGGDGPCALVGKGPPMDFTHDDLAGEVGDAFAEVGELESAGLWYDASLRAMRSIDLDD